MSTKSKIGLILSGLLSISSIFTLYKFLDSDLEALVEKTNQAYVTGRIIGSVTILIIMIFIFVTILLKNKKLNRL